MVPPPPPSVLLSKQGLRLTLVEWHGAPLAMRPALFPGPRADRVVRFTWLDDTIERVVAYANLHTLHWANAIISCIPGDFRRKLLQRMDEKRQRGELEHNNRFWRWNNFARIFYEMCESEITRHRYKVGATALGSAVLVPAAGVAALGVVGFTSGGVAAGSLAASAQSIIYGGATGGVFSVCQSIGARAAFPIIVNAVAGTVGGVAAAGVGNNKGGGGVQQGEIGDIGDP